jgi:hypothetical protein
MKQWLADHGSGIGEKVVAALISTLVLYLLSLVPKLRPLLTLGVPLWLFLATILAIGIIIVLYRRSAARKRAGQATSFEKIVRNLEARDKPTP